MIRVFHGQNDLRIPFELSLETYMAGRLPFAYLDGNLQKLFLLENFFGIYFKIFYQSLIADFEVKNSKTPRTTLIMNHDNCGLNHYYIAISSKQLQATYLITGV